MSFTITDCLKLSAFSEAEVIAGKRGLSQIISSVSVLEWAESDSLKEILFKGNEIVITAFYNIRHDVEAQCKTIERLKEVGEVGLVLYYIGVVVPAVDKRVIETANRLDFPLICMPQNIYKNRYSEAISQIMEAVFEEKEREENLVDHIMLRFSGVREQQKNLGNLLRMISDYLKSSLVLLEGNHHLVEVAKWPVNTSIDVVKIVKEELEEGERYPKSIQVGNHHLVVNYENIHISKGKNLSLYFIHWGKEISDKRSSQVRETIELAMNTWQLYYPEAGFSLLLHFLVHDNKEEVERMSQKLNFDVKSCKCLWIFDGEKFMGKTSLKEKDITDIKLELEEKIPIYDQDFFVGLYRKYIAVYFLKEVHLEEVREGLEELKPLHVIEEKKSIYLENPKETFGLVDKHFEEGMSLYPYSKTLSLTSLEMIQKSLSLYNKDPNRAEDKLTMLKIDNCSQSMEKELIETLAVYLLDGGCSIIQTASIMNLHKNTVKYRMNKWKETLGDNALSIPEILPLYEVMVIYRLIEGKGKV